MTHSYNIFIVVNVNDEKIGCSIGTEETFKADKITPKTMAHPTVLEAQYGVVKVKKNFLFSKDKLTQFTSF